MDKAYADKVESEDWRRVHRRIAAAKTGFDRTFLPGPDDKRRILRERAKLLAVEMDNRSPDDEAVELVEFLLAHEHYGIEAACVREISAIKELRPLPGAPAFVLGLINLRGQIVSVIDIKKFFNLPGKGLTDLNKVLIVRSGEMELGILADAILGVRRIEIANLQAGPTTTGARTEYIKGITSEALVVLDAGKLLSDRKIIVDEG